MRSTLVNVGAALLALTTPALAAEPGPVPANPPVAAMDPARLALARQTVDFVFPAGTYARMMGPQMDAMMDSVADSTMRMSMKDLAALGGADTEKMGPGSMAEIMSICDPAFKERMRIMQRTTMAETSQVMTRFEPELREGLAMAYAKRFDATQLRELNRFFATPTGKAYGADSAVIMMSPEVMQTMQRVMPEVMKAMPVIVQKAKAAAQTLPKPRTYAQLSKAEKEKLAALTGLSTQDLAERATRSDGDWTGE